MSKEVFADQVMKNLVVNEYGEIVNLGKGGVSVSIEAVDVLEREVPVFTPPQEHNENRLNTAEKLNVSKISKEELARLNGESEI